MNIFHFHFPFLHNKIIILCKICGMMSKKLPSVHNSPFLCDDCDFYGIYIHFPCLLTFSFWNREIENVNEKITFIKLIILCHFAIFNYIRASIKISIISLIDLVVLKCLQRSEGQMDFLFSLLILKNNYIVLLAMLLSASDFRMSRPI